MKNLPPLNAIRAFEVVARTGGFTRGQQLPVSPAGALANVDGKYPHLPVTRAKALRFESSEKLSVQFDIGTIGLLLLSWSVSQAEGLGHHLSRHARRRPKASKPH